MPPTSTRLSYEDLLASVPEDGRRYELIDGEVYVSPSPFEKHQRVVVNLLMLWGTAARRAKAGRVYVAPFDTVFDGQNAVQPDILFVSRERLQIVGQVVRGAPDLVAEVLSDSSRSRDRELKMQLYERFGVLEYWIVDPESESVEIHRRQQGSQPFTFAGPFSGGTRLTTILLPGFDAAVEELFTLE